MPLSSTENACKMQKQETSKDVCREKDSAAFFPLKYTAVTSASVAAKGVYCTFLALDASKDTVAVALSDRSVALLKNDTLQSISTLKSDGKGTCTGLRFSPSSSNLVWTSYNEGYIKLWDVRSNKCEKEFNSTHGVKKDPAEEDLGPGPKPLTAFDVSLNERMLCAGTELMETDSYLLFWDIRGNEILGGYWESHSDDISQIKFSPTQADTMASASTDGLINVFDISQKTEDDALTYCMNADVTIDKLSWLRQGGHYEWLAGLTDIHSLQYWDIKKSKPLHEFSREDVTTAMKCNETDDSYLISVDMASEGDDPILLCGSGMEESLCLRTLKLNLRSGLLEPHGVLDCRQQQFMTRAALYQGETDSYITAGECGIVRVWKPEATDVPGKDLSVTHKKKKRVKPY